MEPVRSEDDYYNVIHAAMEAIQSDKTWQARATSAEQRVGELEQERQKLLAEIERLRGVIWIAQFDYWKAHFSVQPAIALCNALGHTRDCASMGDKELPCTCGGIEVAP